MAEKQNAHQWGEGAKQDSSQQLITLDFTRNHQNLQENRRDHQAQLMTPAADTDKNILDFVYSIQAGQLNGIKPADCGPFADILTEAARAFEQGGTIAAMRAVTSDPALMALVAGGGDTTTSPALFPHYNLTAGLQLPDKNYLVYGVIGERDMGMIYGDAAAGKTYLAIDLAVSMAAGLPWMGRWDVVTPRKVCYFISEGQRRFFRRILAAVNGMGARGYDTDHIHRLIDDNLTIVTEVPQLFNQTSARSVDAYLQSWQQLGSPEVEFVFIDTLHRASVGSDENNSRDAGVVVDNITRLQRQMGCAAAFVHHSNKTGGYRGSTAYRGSVDFVFRVDGARREPRRLTIDKLRDGEQDGPVEGVNYVSVFRVDKASAGTYATWLDNNTAGDYSEPDRKTQAKTEILQALNNGPVSKNQLAERVTSIAKSTAERYINSLIMAGEVVTKPGPRNSLMCSLPQSRK